MIAVIDTSKSHAWAQRMGDTPWPLLPVANRPLLDYWLETCADAGALHVHLVLGDAANSAARLSGSADQGEVLISEAAYAAAGLENGDLESRSLELKGKSVPMQVHVLTNERPLTSPAKREDRYGL